MELRTMKPKDVKIISITIKPDNTNIIYGLGDDNMIYFWIASDHLWQLWG